MRQKQSILILGVVVVAVIALVLLKNSANQTSGESSRQVELAESEGQSAKKLPMLVDLGKGTCKACKKMKPILEELTLQYQGRAIVKFIDLRYEPQEARKYGIRLIPTQIFYDAEGNEVYRHEGFMGKRAIKSKFAEMGVD
ncbi:MAG: thioredoxin family protein [Candidatus Zixiibacteriota bacterium]|nr:MAG: thioredoxin family protein [candidate division Zixibacteria bacterium]